MFFFFKHLALRQSLSSCTISEKTNDPILRKFSDVWTDKRRASNIIRDYFKAHFNNPKESKLEPFIDNPRPLDTPITKDEAAKSIQTPK